MRALTTAFVLVAIAAACSDDCPRLTKHPTIDLEAVAVAPSLSFFLPVDALAIPDRPGFFYVAEQIGVVHLVDFTNETSEPVLDLTDRVASFQVNWELGLYAFTLHPNYPQDRRAYVSFTEERPEARAASVVLELTLEPDGRWSRENERVVFFTEQPLQMHNGGTIRFLADGRLGLALGDGGFGSEPNAQAPDSPLGKLLALDVDATQSPAPWEALALGFRNPWKWSVDAQSGAVFLGDVGNLEREELNRFVPGGNYGWPRFEGTREDEAMPLCEDCGALTEPVVEYCHNVGSSITAGVVYRGAGIPEMNGQYVFGDFGKGRLFLVPADATSTHDLVTIGTTAVSITGFVHDHAGELLLLDRSGGGFFRLETIDRSQDPPSRLSESGFVDPRDPWSPPEVALEYAIQWPFFSDDADKGRWIIPPEEGTATVLADGDLDFPPGTVFVKRFELDGRRVETRAFVHTEGGRWRGYSYRWRDDGRDATLLPGSARAQIGDVPWYFPSRTECLSCHTRAASFALGPTMPQLAGDPQQVEAMIDRGLLAADVELPAPLPAADGEEGVSVRARAYLDVNCASCHRPGGPGGGALDLRFDTPLEDSGLCGEAQVDTLGIDDPRIVAPGDLSRSVLWRRLVALDQTRMHPFRQTRDSQGETIIRAWIDEVQCP